MNQNRRFALASWLWTSAAYTQAPLNAFAQVPPSAFAKGTAIDPMQKVRYGRVERYDNFPSTFVEPRHIEIWLPPSYDGRREHAVLYMHDGQMLFDAETTWNKQSWAVDQVAAPMIDRGLLRNFIVVAPWNLGPLRFAEYFPQAWFKRLSTATQVRLQQRMSEVRLRSDEYLRFLVHELKPWVDDRYKTLRAREHCMLMGSSMGAVISLYALCEYPEIFVGAACLSTHWIGGYERNPEVPNAALEYLSDRLPEPARVRLWMDRGTIELDALYEEAQQAVDRLLYTKGFRAPGFKSLVHEGSGHNERDWHRHLPGPLSHLFSSTSQ